VNEGRWAEAPRYTERFQKKPRYNLGAKNLGTQKDSRGLAVSLIRDEKLIVLFEKNCQVTVKSEATNHVQGDAGHPG
jgi:hypothetical protein